MLGLDYKQRFTLPVGSLAEPSVSKLRAPCGQPGYVSFGINNGATVELWRYQFDSGTANLWSVVQTQTGKGSTEVRIYVPGEYLALLNYSAIEVQAHVVFIPLWPDVPMSLSAEVSRGY